jgi:hypothetical protein
MKIMKNYEICKEYETEICNASTIKYYRIIYYTYKDIVCNILNIVLKVQRNFKE